MCVRSITLRRVLCRFKSENVFKYTFLIYLQRAMRENNKIMRFCAKMFFHKCFKIIVTKALVNFPNCPTKPCRLAVQLAPFQLKIHPDSAAFHFLLHFFSLLKKIMWIFSSSIVQYLHRVTTMHELMKHSWKWNRLFCSNNFVTSWKHN